MRSPMWFARLCDSGGMHVGILGGTGPAGAINATLGEGTATNCWGGPQNNGQATNGLEGSYGYNSWLYYLGYPDNTNGDSGAVGNIGGTWNGSTANSTFGGQPLAAYWWSVGGYTAGVPSTSIPVFLDAVWPDGYPLSSDLNAPTPAFSIYNAGMTTGNKEGEMLRFCVARHGSSNTNVVYLDGHAETISLRQLWQLQWYRSWQPPIPSLYPVLPTK